MQFRPIISAMRRNKVGAILIAVQMAITLAILCNALFIIQQRVVASKRPTGVDEANVVVLDNQWVGNPSDQLARQQADLAALRSLPGVQDAFATNTVPLTDAGSSTGVSLHPDQKSATASAALYFGDEHAIAALGLKLIAGRNFNSDEVVDKIGYNDLKPPAAIIITKGLAEKLFPGANAVGQSIYDRFLKGQVPIVGVVDRLQVPWVSLAGFGGGFAENSIIQPFRFLSPYPILMFEVPFKFGRAWPASDDESRATVIVLSHEMNEKLFGGVNSVGKTVRLGDQPYTVSGVLDEWRPLPRFYDLAIRPFGDGDTMFMPFSTAIEKHLGNVGSTQCNGDVDPGWEGRLRSDCIWLQFWVELPTVADAQTFRAFLNN